MLGGQIISEVNADGGHDRTYVYDTSGAVVARQVQKTSGQTVEWEHKEPSGATVKHTNLAQTTATGREEDPNGVAIRRQPNDPSYQPEFIAGFNNTISDLDALTNGGCTIDGAAATETLCNALMRNDSVLPKALAHHQSDEKFKFEHHGFGIYRGAYYEDTPDTMRKDPVTGEEIPVFNTVLREFTVAFTFTNNTNFTKCLNLSRLATFNWEGMGAETANFGKKQADLIFNAYLQEMQGNHAPNVTAAMLAFTWRRETVFALNPTPNPNLENNPTNNPQYWDVGPMHVNRDYDSTYLKNGKLSYDGLNMSSIYGSNAYYDSGHPKERAAIPQGYGNSSLPFNGDVSQNLRAGIRRLEIAAGSDRERVAYYGPASVREQRRQQWDKVGKAWETFFNCYGSSLMEQRH